MPEEIKKLNENVQNIKEHVHNDFLKFYEGTLHGRPVIYAASNVGMVFAASVVTTLINQFKCHTIIFSGVAGGLVDDIEIGEVVLVKDVLNYEMNCKEFILPFAPDHRHKLGELPFISLREFASDEKLLNIAKEAAEEMQDKHGVKHRVARIVSGSEFVTLERKKALKEVWEECGNPHAVEMEGAAVAQICKAYKVPFLLVRSISDNMSGDASEDFSKFCQEAADNCYHIVEAIVQRYEPEE